MTTGRSKRSSRAKSIEKEVLSTEAPEDAFTDWNWNVFELASSSMQLAFVHRLSGFFNMHGAFGLSLEEIGPFYNDVHEGYLERNTHVARRYHTFLHAVDVMQSVGVFLHGFQGQKVLSSLTSSALLIAALCHDIGHVGLTNQFLVKSGHPLTLEYRNPVLESMHTARTLLLIKKHGFLKNLETKEALRISKTIARCIMYTDVSIHSELLRKTRDIEWPMDFSHLGEEDSFVYCGFLLHTADICNPAKEWPLAQRWTDLIMSEFFEQGALEKREGLVVSTFRNADQINTSEIQANFVRLMLHPTLALMIQMLPKASLLKEIAEKNRLQWEVESHRALTVPQIELIRALSRPLSTRQMTFGQEYKEKLTRLSESEKVMLFFLLTSLYAAFAYNIHIAYGNVSGDTAFGICTLIVFVIMLVDVLLATMTNPNYRWSFYFGFDLISSLSLLADIPFIIMGNKDSIKLRTEPSQNAQVRLFRILRVVRLATLFKHFKQFMVKRSYRRQRSSLRSLNSQRSSAIDPCSATFSIDDLKRIFQHDDGRAIVFTLEHVQQLVRGAYRGYPPPDNAIGNFCHRIASSMAQAPMRHFKFSLSKFQKVLSAMEEEYDRDLNSTNQISQLNFYASRLGEKVADTTIRHVIFLLLAILIILTECNLPRTINPSLYGLKKLHHHSTSPTLSRQVQFYVNATDPMYLYIANANNSIVQTSLAVASTDRIWNQSDISFDNGQMIISSRILSSVRLEFVQVVQYPNNCVWNETSIPCQSIAIFDHGADAKTAAFWEMARAVFIIFCFTWGSAILTLDVYNRVIVPVERMVSLTQQLALNPTKSLSAEEEEKPMYEMKLLQSTLTKVARLLQIGYGSAGSAIISKNMMGAEFNPIIAGKKVHAVFGFCDIRRFTDITECLQEQVMMFTNTIGHIVHHAAYTFNGNANKNVGDAFLLVWQISEDSPDVAVINQARPPAHLTSAREDEVDCLFFDEEGSKKMAQSKVYVATVADNALMAFLKTMVDIDTSPKLKAYKTNKLLQTRFEIPFQVKMGYGLHVGWAIDGAIGSKYKIDASYLSSDVNMAATLESTTKLYHVPLIMSHSFYNLLSPQLQQFCRCIDCVLFEGCSKPTALYTFDCVNPNVRQFRGIIDVPLLQMGLQNGFTSTFEKGVNEYFAGHWKEAKDTFDFLLSSLKPNDGPTEALIKFMQRSSFQAPVDWKGYRKL
ncbi:hypothetical protein THRCLA_00592 [Thraustotheca clavata]|uniref:Phosphodiesterase n=1 Tax=Thraustotheca clavata TaxID=74557 RepID=A0A1W0AAQ0_9STRA|nr:hypothetical protein THRCLA_00592 [Thraustotheca clavata]